MEFAEIIICDGGSTDDTIAIAEQFGCKILTQAPAFKYKNGKIKDFSGVRNQTINAASHKWFIYIDSDEYLSEYAVNELRAICTQAVQFDRVALLMPRMFSINDILIEHAASYPNYHSRVFHLDHVIGFKKRVHEQLVLKPGVTYAKLSHPVIVPLDTNTEDIKRKHSYYLSIEREKIAHLRLPQRVRVFYRTMRTIVVRICKVVYLRLFRRGVKLPLIQDWLAIRYHAVLLMIILSPGANKQTA